MPNKKVCVIGAGPSGMSFMCWAAKFAREGRKVPEVTCFEKQSDWGGLWNYSWRTGTDENGEPVHGSMYRSGSREKTVYCDNMCSGTCGQMGQKSVLSCPTTPSRSITNNLFHPFHQERSSLTISRVDGRRKT